MKERLNNDTVVDLQELSDQELITLIESREDQIGLMQNPDRRAGIQSDVGKFLDEIVRRQRAYTPECGDIE